MTSKIGKSAQSIHENNHWHLLYEKKLQFFAGRVAKRFNLSFKNLFNEGMQFKPIILQFSIKNSKVLQEISGGISK